MRLIASSISLPLSLSPGAQGLGIWGVPWLKIKIPKWKIPKSPTKNPQIPKADLRIKLKKFGDLGNWGIFQWNMKSPLGIWGFGESPGIKSKSPIIFRILETEQKIWGIGDLGSFLGKNENPQKKIPNSPKPSFCKNWGFGEFLVKILKSPLGIWGFGESLEILGIFSKIHRPWAPRS